MESPLRSFLCASLAAHVAAGAMVFGRAATLDLRGQTDRQESADVETPDALDPETWVGIDSIDGENALPGPPSAAPPPAATGSATHREGQRERARASRAALGAGGSERGGANAESAGSGGTRFGAVGDRAAVDLATAFTRGFPQAASADPAWIAAPFGGAGEASVALRLDEGGSLVGVDVRGAPSSALRAGIARTIALLRARAFTASGPVTKLRVVAKVAPDEVHDGLHGEVFAIGGSFETSQGSAFFALAIGRRIDVTVRVAR